MRLVVLCGMPAEKAVLQAALSGVLILSGTDKLNLATLVPPDTTHIASCGLFGGLSPAIKIGQIMLAGCLDDGETKWFPDLDWASAVVNAIRVITVAAGPAYPQTPDWAAHAAIVSWYSSGVLDQADTQTQRAELFAQTGAWSIDDESFSVARFAKARGIPFVIMRSCSDDATETLPLAARGAIMNPNGSANLDYLFEAIANEPFAQTLDLVKIATDFNMSLNTLSAAAPALLSSLNQED